MAQKFKTKLNLNIEKQQQITGDTFVFSGNTFFKNPIKYLSNQSSNYNTRSLTDNGYVTGITSTLLSISNFNTYSGITLTNINSRVLTSVFNTFTGTTISSTYLKISNFNPYSASTLTNINSRLLISSFNTYSGVTLTNINSRLLTSIFNTYSGTTAPATYLKISNFNPYSASTLTSINSKLSTSLFNSYTGTTAPATYLKIANFNVYSGSTLTNINSKVSTSLFNSYTGTTAPAQFQSHSSIVTLTGTTLPATYALRSNFNTYTGTTAPATYALKTIFNTYTGTTAPATYALKTTFNTYTGTTALNTFWKNNGTTIVAGPTISGTTRFLTGSFKLTSLSSVDCLVFDNTLRVAINSGLDVKGSSSKLRVFGDGTGGNSNRTSSLDTAGSTVVEKLFNSGSYWVGASTSTLGFFGQTGTTRGTKDVTDALKAYNLISSTAKVDKINGVSLSGLTTGLLKVTGGVPSIATVLFVSASTVGINTTNPQANLQINGIGSIPTLKVVGLGTSTNLGYAQYQSDNSTLVFSIADNGVISNTTNFTASANNQSAWNGTQALTSRSTANDSIFGENNAITFNVMSTGIVPVGLNLGNAYVQTGGINSVFLATAGGGVGMTAGSYTNVSPSSTSGSGSGAKFNVTVTTTTMTIATVVSGGTNYNVNDTVTFNGSLFGGSGSITITINTVKNINLGSTATALRINISGQHFSQNPKLIDFQYGGSSVGSISVNQLATNSNVTILSFNDSAGSSALNYTTTSLTIPKAASFSGSLGVSGIVSFQSQLNIGTNIPNGTALLNNGNLLASNGVSVSSVGSVGGFLSTNNTHSQYKLGTTVVAGVINTFGTITGGTGYNGGVTHTFNGVALTGGTGVGGTANVTVTSGIVTAVSVSSRGSGYLAGDKVGVSNANLGGSGSGFKVPIATVDFSGNIVAGYNDSSSWVDASSPNSYYSFYSAPTINQTNQATGNFAGLYFNPTITSLKGNLYGVLVQPSSALNGFGTGTPTATLQINGSGSNPTLKIVGAGTTTNYSIRSFQSDGTTEVYSLLDNGTTNNTANIGTVTANNSYTFTNTTTQTSRATASDVIGALKLNSTITASAASIDAQGIFLKTKFNSNGGITSGANVGLQNPSIDRVSSNLAGMSLATTFTGVTQTSTNGTGTGAKFTVITTTATGLASVNCTTPGSGYNLGDTITFNGSLFGGSGSITLAILSTTNGFGANAAPLIITNPFSDNSGISVPLISFRKADGVTSLGGLSINYLTSQLNSTTPTLVLSDALGTVFYSDGTNVVMNRNISLGAKNITNISALTASGTATFTVVNQSGQYTNSDSNINANTNASGAAMNFTGSLYAAVAGNIKTSIRGGGSISTGVPFTYSITSGGTGYANGAASGTGGAGSGANFTLTTSSGVITAAVPVASNGSTGAGSGYAVNDVLTAVQAGGANGKVKVTAIDQYGGILTLISDERTITDPTSNNTYSTVYAKPTINITSTQAGQVAAFYYNPTLTNLGSFKNYGVLIAPSSSLNGFGTNTPIATVHVKTGTLGNAVERLESTAVSNTNPNKTVYQNKLLTTGATVTTIHTLAIATGTTTQIKGVVTARRTGGSLGTAQDGAGFTFDGVYSNTGNTKQIGSPTINVIGRDQAGWAVTLTPSASNLLVQVNGAANNNVSWGLNLEVFTMSQ